MPLSQSIRFWIVKLSKLSYFNIRYRLNKWVKIEGVSLPVYLSYGYNVLRFIDNGQYESGEIRIIKETLGPGDKVLELGTGLGFISTYCAKKIGSENVYTFEANPYLRESIRELYTRNGVDPHLEFAILGKEEGKTVFYRNKESLLASGLEGSSIRSNQQIEVLKKNLNAKIKEIRPTYLIMDIEGGEYDIFMEIDFQTIRKIQFELHPTILDAPKIDQIFKKLEKNNFSRDGSFNGQNNYYFFKDR